MFDVMGTASIRDLQAIQKRAHHMQCIDWTGHLFQESFDDMIVCFHCNQSKDLLVDETPAHCYHPQGHTMKMSGERDAMFCISCGMVRRVMIKVTEVVK